MQDDIIVMTDEVVHGGAENTGIQATAFVLDVLAHARNLVPISGNKLASDLLK